MSTQKQDAAGEVAQGTYVPGTTQNVTVSGTTARTASDLSASIIRLAATTACYVQFGGSSVEADNTGFVMAAGAVEHFARGSHTRVAALQVSAGGVLSVTELN